MSTGAPIQANYLVSHGTRNTILNKHIEKGYLQDVEEGLRDRRCYNTAGKAFETLSKILIAFGGILSFSSGYYSNPHLGFAAGSVSTVSLACLQFSSFCYKESKKNGENVNAILAELHIQTLPHPESPKKKSNEHKVNIHLDEEE